MTIPCALLVDDQRDVVRLLRATLNTLGHEMNIIEAPSGEEALLEASRRKIDLLVVDYGLAGISGVETMRKIRIRYPSMKSVIITGWAERKVLEEIRNSGVDAYFFKPIPLADFLDAVERFLGFNQTIFPPVEETSKPPLQKITTEPKKKLPKLGVENPPKVFISYAWEDDVIKWVRNFAARLRADGVDAILDQWSAVPGDPLSDFMEKSLRESEYVLVVCTPKYKNKSDGREGGVGYEGNIITGELLAKNNHRKFIPVLYKGPWQLAAPSWASSKFYVDLSDSINAGENYRNLLRTLYRKNATPPPLGGFPDFLNEE
ncbi:MAG: TIR domain-containing protein [Anaerolineales bacterium]|nr:TIR domain-containing protein [Anaerolineales bacterium]